MPARIFPYLKGLIQGFKPTATFLQIQFGFSHDSLTRMLNKRFPWQQILLFVISRFFGSLKDGYLILDDTVIAKPYSKNLEGAGFAYSSSLDKTVYGYHIVLLVWTDGIVSIPLSWRFYKKGGKSKIKLAQELLSDARRFWKLNPCCVLFDSWYAASQLLDQIRKYHWHFVCQIKKNRVVSGAPIGEDLIREGDFLKGPISDTVMGLIIRHDDKFFLTDQLSFTLEKILSLYRLRWPIEEVFRFLKDQLHLQGCQARGKTSQENHLGSCILSYLLIQKEQQETQSPSMYAVKQRWLINKRLGNNRLNHYVKVLSA